MPETRANPPLFGGRPATAIMPARIPYAEPQADTIEIHFDSPVFDFAIRERPIDILNGRMSQPAPDLEREGFALVHWPSDVIDNHRDALIEQNAQPAEIVPPTNLAYIDEHIPLIAALSGAREVFAQHGMISVRFSDRAAQRSWLPTAAFAHFDFERSEIDRMLAETIEISGRRVAPYRRHVLYQTWRPITPAPLDRPLALCDSRTISIEDVVPMAVHGPRGSRSELVRSRACRFNPAHRWTYFPDITTAELLVFKGYDSAMPDARTALHTAFDDTHATAPVPRGSVECRFIALFD